jgi:hypothetical protein
MISRRCAARCGVLPRGYHLGAPSGRHATGYRATRAQSFPGQEAWSGRRPAPARYRYRSAGQVRTGLRSRQVLCERAEGLWREECVAAGMRPDAAVADRQVQLVREVLDTGDAPAEGGGGFGVGDAGGAEALDELERSVAGRAAFHHPDRRRSRTRSTRTLCLIGLGALRSGWSGQQRRSSIKRSGRRAVSGFCGQTHMSLTEPLPCV